MHTFKASAAPAVRKGFRPGKVPTYMAPLNAPVTRQECDLLALYEQGRIDQAGTQAEELTARSPRQAFAWKVLGIVRAHQGRYAESLAASRAFAKLLPNDPDANNLLGDALLRCGFAAEAAEEHRKAIAGNPDFILAYLALAMALRAQGRLSDALEVTAETTARWPDSPQALCTHGVMLFEQTQLAAAEAVLRRSVALRPDAQTYNNLGNVMHARLQIKAAVDSYRSAIALNPHLHSARSNMLFCLAHDIDTGRDELYAEHLAFGRQLQASVTVARPEFTNTREPNRTLRIGLLSNDMRHHPVARYLEPMLESLHLQPGLELHAFHNQMHDDEVTNRLRKHFVQWHPVCGLSNHDLAEFIRAQKIDILMDLAGHTTDNRLLAVARRPAPVQVCWLGYPGSTGMDALDYFIADRDNLPPEQFAQCFAEKLVLLPVNATFRASSEAPDVNPLPALTEPVFTFGSFHRLRKLNPATIIRWSYILRAVPQSRLLLGGMPRDFDLGPLPEWFAQLGIGRDRLLVHPAGSVEEDLALHHRIDLCLDAYPYNGSTTTHNSLWMGVPTLTITGATVVGRMGHAILHHVGLPGFVAADDTGLVRNAMYWASHIEELAELRAGLRQRMSESPLCRHEEAAKAMASALRAMWTRWCDGLPPQMIEITAE